MLGSRLQRERVDRHAVLAEAHLHVAASQKRRQLSVAVPEIQDDGQRRVLLGMRHQEVQQEALPAPCGSEHERVPDVLDMQVEGVWCVVRRLEDRERFLAQVRTDPFALVAREQEAHVRKVRFEQRDPSQVVRAVPRHDAQPGIEQVVGLFEQTPVVHRHGLHRFGGLVLQDPRVLPVEGERQRAAAEEVAVDLQLRQRVAKLADGGVRRVVDQHLLGTSLGRHVVDQRDALVEEVSPTALEVAAHPVAGNALPFEARDQLAGDLVQVLQQERERLARRLLHRQHLDEAVTDHQVVAMAVDGRVRHEVVEMCVVRQTGRVDGRWVVVHELPEEAKRVGLGEACEADVADLHLECLSFVVQRADGSVQFCLKDVPGVVGRQPGPKRVPRGLPGTAKLRAPPYDMRSFVEKHEVQRQVVEFITTRVQVRRAALDGLVCDGLWARCRDDRCDRSLEQVLIDPAVLVQQAQPSLEAVPERLALRVGQALVVDAANAVDDTDMTRLRQECCVIHEAPERQQTIDAARLAVVVEDAREPHHGATSISTRSCLPGS